MGQPAEKPRPRATYADLEAASPLLVAEIVRGTLHASPRPAPRHATASSELGVELGGMFGPRGPGRGGPGGWRILDEPELHFPDPAAPGEIEVLVPDVAGWLLERMPELPEAAYFSLAPDWICEVLSKSTEAFDRDEKMPVYAREGVRHAWLLDPVKRTLEVYRIVRGPRWSEPVVHHGAARVRIEPFEALDLDLSVLWG